MEYENASDLKYNKVKYEDTIEWKAGERFKGNNTYSFLEGEVIMKVEANQSREMTGAGARAQVFRVKDANVEARFLGADVGAIVGKDLRSFAKEGHVLGAEARARATLTEAKVGPVNLHLGAGISTAAKVEGGTVEAKLAGCGLKVGKMIGVSVFDNELSVDTLTLVGKGWLW